MGLIDKAALVAEIERRITAYQKNFDKADNKIARLSTDGRMQSLKELLSFLDTIEVKEVNIASMADEYYDALMKEAAVWMDEGTMCHCRLAYYTGCKDVLNKIQKGE